MKWAIIGTVLAAIGLVYLRFSLRFARNRKLVMKQTGERWYRVACKEVCSEHGREFLRKHFAETLLPERARTENERLFAQVAALGVYLRLIDEKGKDAIQYDTLPVDSEAVSHARVLSRMAIPSWFAKDAPPIFTRLGGC
jgi:hypothetical protein